MSITTNYNDEEIEINFVTSDLHISHKNIAVYAQRPFDNSYSTSHMDETLIQNWNELISIDSTVLVLGDVALGRIEDSLQKISRLNGRKLLVPGNHDRICSLESKARQERFRALYEEVGFEILDENISLDINGVDCLASHYPYSEDRMDRDKFVKVRPKNEGKPLLHGHTHSHSIYSENPLEFHVGVDSHDLRPVMADEIENWVASLSL